MYFGPKIFLQTEKVAAEATDNYAFPSWNMSKVTTNKNEYIIPMLMRELYF